MEDDKFIAKVPFGSKINKHDETGIDVEYTHDPNIEKWFTINGYFAHVKKYLEDKKKYLVDFYSLDLSKKIENIETDIDLSKWKRSEKPVKRMEEDHGMGCSHNVSIPGDENTMNKPTVGPLYEYEKPEARKMAVQSGDTDRALKMIFQWTRMGQITYDEYEDLLVELVHKIISKVK